MMTMIWRVVPKLTLTMVMAMAPVHAHDAIGILILILQLAILLVLPMTARGMESGIVIGTAGTESALLLRTKIRLLWRLRNLDHQLELDHPLPLDLVQVGTEHHEGEGGAAFLHMPAQPVGAKGVEVEAAG